MKQLVLSFVPSEKWRNPENNSDNNLQVICQMCNLIKHAGQGCEIQAVVDLYRKSKYNQNAIIKITRKMRDEGSKDFEIIRVLELREKVSFKMDLRYLGKLFGFVSSRQPIEKDMFNFVMANNNIIFMLTLIGTYDLSLELEVPSYEIFEQIIKKFREKFSDNIKDFEMVLNTQEFKYDFYPFSSQ